MLRSYVEKLVTPKASLFKVPKMQRNEPILLKRYLLMRDSIKA
jgi:hypothetical protein